MACGLLDPDAGSITTGGPPGEGGPRWALRGFTDAATLGGGIGTVVAPVAAILAFSADVVLVAALLASKAVRGGVPTALGGGPNISFLAPAHRRV